MKVIQNNDGMVGQQFLQGCSRLMKESQKNAGSFCCVFGSKINYSLTIHTDLTRLRIMIPHVWIAYKLHQFYRFQIPWNQKKKTSTLTHLPKNHKSFTCFSGVFPPPEAWTNDDTRHLRHRDVWWGGFFSTEVPFFFTSQNKVWQSKSLKARKVSWRKLPFTISKHILYIYIYCTLYIYLKYFATFPWWSLLPKQPTVTAIVTASGMETAMLSFPGVLLQELCTALLFKSWKANIIQGPKPLLSRSNCRLCIFCCTPIIQLHTTANLALLFPSRFIISSFWRCQTLVALRFHFQLYRLWPIWSHLPPSPRSRRSCFLRWKCGLYPQFKYYQNWLPKVNLMLWQDFASKFCEQEFHDIFSCIFTLWLSLIQNFPPFKFHSL